MNSSLGGAQESAGFPVPTMAPTHAPSEDPVSCTHLFHAFFDRVLPLRCFAFIHKPSFLYALDHGTLLQDYEEPLLHIMCALGASNVDPGQALADKARDKVLGQLHNPSDLLLMTTVLLCEYAHRSGSFAMAFVLGGCMFRQLRLLGLDALSDNANHELIEPEAESHLRLAWACYIADVFTGSGVDKNSSWRDETPNLPLPCAEGDYLSQSSTRPLYLPYVLENPDIIRSLDAPALSVLLVHLRMRVLRLIRTPHPKSNLWDLSSPFMVILQQLEQFHDNLPEKYALTELNIYIRKDQHSLGSLFALHLLYHAAVCDLTRISLPGFSFPLAVAFWDAPPEFLLQCQKRSQFHAEEISRLVRQGKPHGRLAFDDPFAVDATFESTKIQIIASAIMPHTTESTVSTRNNVADNLQLLKFLGAGASEPSPYIRALLSLCMSFGFQEIAGEWQGPEA
ncbi:hypothetical protein BP5796_12031 [Coleophoma crateriformis]|uniref:Xylanolytic transcriptional activator regulatory domain-containing protein n=1 Tax=Coleophoma crateriformis TaxID=565419 RepID=A0A3D8QBM2_9HELO|nr:hypothetical protein BP5796_12031 [Coleophoma crateriformis]